MALTKLGSYIEQLDARNADDTFGADAVVGLSTQKQIIKTKADLNGVKLTSYKLFPPTTFAYVPDTSRRGDKMSLAFNRTGEIYLVSSISIVFKVSHPESIVPDYLFMYFNRPEFDRYARFNSWGSARETFSWDEMCDIDIDLPPIEIQQKYVDVYNSMLANQQSYERGLEDLNIVCEALLEKYKRDVPRSPLGELISEVDARNVDGKIESVQGVNKDKQFMPSVASSSDILKYKIVSTGQFAVNLMHVGRDVAIPVAVNTGEPIIVSPAYTVFEVSNKEVSPEFVLMWLSRSETDRLAWFMSDTNVRSGMEKTRFYEIEIPKPSLAEQNLLVEIFQAMDLRKHINDRLKERIKNMCPILIKGSLEEAGV